MDNFDEAKTATEEMFNAEETPTEETPVVEEQPTQEEPPVSPETNVANEATQIAEQATQIAEQQNAELAQAMSDNEALRRQNEELQKTISEMSQANKEEVVEEAMKMPVLDFNELAFADEETQRKAQQDYVNAVSEMARRDIMKELSPFVEQAKEAQAMKAKNEAIATLSQMPELSGIEQMLPQLDKIIANNKWLSSADMPIDEKLINAYAIARGVNAINTPVEEKKEPTAEELMELYDKNPTFQELIEKKRIEAVKGSQQVPQFSASSGAVNVALNIKEKPKTFEEASERTRKMFGA